MAKKKFSFGYLAKNFSVAVGLVLVWRGIWYVLDGIDVWLFGGSHLWTGLVGIIAGLLILYLPDKDLKEIERLRWFQNPIRLQSFYSGYAEFIARRQTLVSSMPPRSSFGSLGIKRFRNE